MKVVIFRVLDEITEQQKEKLKEVGELVGVSGKNLTEEKVIESIKDAEIIVAPHSSVASISQKVIDSAPKLKMIALPATRFDYVDLDYAKSKDIVVTYVSHYATEAVAEHVFALLLALNRHIIEGYRKAVESKEKHAYMPGFELKGKILGIIGFGQIGQRVAEIGKGFDMNVMFYNRSEKKLAIAGQVSLEKLIKESDVISINCPLNDESKNRISKKEFDMMKNNAVLINAAVVGVVDEDALINALKEKKIVGAALDVWENEELTRLDNVLLTPQIGYCTNEAVKRCDDIWINNVVSFSKGEVKNKVGGD